MSKFLMHLFAAFAEMERGIIRERVCAGVRAAKIPDRVRQIWSRLRLSEIPSPVFTLSRRQETPDALEAVLALRGGRPDFGPALASVAKGDYEAELTPLHAAGGTVKIGIHWTPPKAGAAGPSIRPGLYTLRLTAKKGPPGRTAAVLIGPDAQVPSLTNGFCRGR